MAAIQVNVRYPELLLKRIDAVTKNRSEWILEACRMRLDGAAKEEFVKHWEQKFDEVSAPAKPDMQALRDICAGKKSDIQPANGAAVFVEHEVRHYDVESLMQPRFCIECDHAMKESKGKWACVDLSCGMYGKEQKPR